MSKFFIGALTAISLLMGAHLGRAQDRVRVGWAAMTASHTPLWVAQDRGFFAKQGLVAESIFFGAGPPAMQALVAGDLDIVITSAPNVVNPRLGGVDAVMILSIIPTFIDHIISAANITTTEQLRGKIGSVNRFGSISEMGLRLSLRRLGIDPEKDVTIVPAGGNPERLASISKGISQFTIMNEPFIKRGREAWVCAIWSAWRHLKIPLAWQRYRDAGKRSSRTKSPIVSRFVRARSPKRFIILKPKRKSRKLSSANTLKFTDPEGLERTYKNYTSVLLDVPYAEPAGIKTLLDDMAPKNPKAAAADPRAFVDASFVHEMETSGFLKQLHKR